MVNINDVLDGHVGLDLDCVDRLYLNAYVPNLQVGGQVVTFLTAHLGFPIPSPALLEKIGNRFRRDVKAFAGRARDPDPAPEEARPHPLGRPQARPRPALSRARPKPRGASGWWPSWRPRSSSGCSAPRTARRRLAVVSFDFVKEDRRVGMYYFYILDPEFGPGFIKICTYFPYPAKVWLNGHEWAKRQADRAGIAFTELANGFASCDDPAAPPGHLRPLRPGRHPGLLRPLDPQ